MLTLHKRHSATCLGALKKNKKISLEQRRFFKHCACACWVTGVHPITREYVKKALGTSSWDAAEKLKIKLETGTPESLTSEMITIEKAFDGWIADKKRLGVSEQTLEGNHRALGKAILRYTKHAGITKLTSLDKTHARAMVDAWSAPVKEGALGEGWAPSTVAGHLGRLRDFCGFAVECYGLAKNPAAKIKPPQGDGDMVDPFTPDEEGRIAKALDTEWWQMKGVKRSLLWSRHPETLRCLVHVLQDTGMRISDALRVRPEIVREERDGSGTVSLQQWKLDGRFARKNSDVTVYLTAETLHELKSVRRLSNKYTFMVECQKEADRNDFKEHMKSEVMCAWYVFKKVLGRAAQVEDLRPHRFRHTFAAKKLMNGWRLEDVARLLGHKDTKTLEGHYAKWIPARQEQLREKVAREREAHKAAVPALRRLA